MPVDPFEEYVDRIPVVPQGWINEVLGGTERLHGLFLDERVDRLRRAAVLGQPRD